MAMTAGMAFEALNHVAGSGADMMVVLNDNNMSISENVGAPTFSEIDILLSFRTTIISAPLPAT